MKPSPKKAGRPLKLRFAPESHKEAILRAVLPEHFPHGLGWMLFYMHHCRQMIAEMQAGPDWWDSTPGALPMAREDLIRDLGDALALTEAKFAKASAAAIRVQDVKFFGLVFTGLDALQSNGRDELVRRAVAGAWFNLSYGSESPPKAGLVAAIANSMLPDYLTTSRVVKLLDSMALPYSGKASP